MNMNYEEAFDNVIKYVEIFMESVVREIDQHNLNYLLKDKALEMGLCPNVKGALFETAYVDDKNDVIIRFKDEDNSVLDYYLSEITTLEELQIGIVCKRVLEMKKTYEVSFSVPKVKLTGVLNIEAFNGIHAREIAENKLTECLDYSAIVHEVKLK